MRIIHPNVGIMKGYWDGQCTPRPQCWQESSADRRHLCISHCRCRTSQHTIFIIMQLINRFCNYVTTWKCCCCTKCQPAPYDWSVLVSTNRCLGWKSHFTVNKIHLHIAAYPLLLVSGRMMATLSVSFSGLLVLKRTHYLLPGVFEESEVYQCSCISFWITDRLRKYLAVSANNQMEKGKELAQYWNIKEFQNGFGDVI